MAWSAIHQIDEWILMRQNQSKWGFHLVTLSTINFYQSKWLAWYYPTFVIFNLQPESTHSSYAAYPKHVTKYIIKQPNKGEMLKKYFVCETLNHGEKSKYSHNKCEFFLLSDGLEWNISLDEGILVYLFCCRLWIITFAYLVTNLSIWQTAD